MIRQLLVSYHNSKDRLGYVVEQAVVEQAVVEEAAVRFPEMWDHFRCSSIVEMRKLEQHDTQLPAPVPHPFFPYNQFSDISPVPLS